MFAFPNRYFTENRRWVPLMITTKVYTVVLGITGVARTVIITTRMEHSQDDNSGLCSGNTFSETKIQRLQLIMRSL